MLAVFDKITEKLVLRPTEHTVNSKGKSKSIFNKKKTFTELPIL